MKKQSVRICPKCGSTEISVAGYHAPHSFCKKCGYGKLTDGIKTIFPEVDIEELKSVKEEIKNANKDGYRSSKKTK